MIIRKEESHKLEEQEEDSGLICTAEQNDHFEQKEKIPKALASKEEYLLI